MKNAIFGLGSVVVFVLLGWLFTFGAASPCDALRAQAAAAYAAETPEVRAAVQDGIGRLNPVQCAAIALRLKAGDRSAIAVTVIHK